MNNPDVIPESSSYERIIYDLKPQSSNTEIIVCFMDMVDSGKLLLLEKKKDSDFEAEDYDNMIDKMNPYVQTDFLIEEVSNLKLLQNGIKLKVEQNVKKINKDRYSSLAYALFFCKEFEDYSTTDSDEFKDLEGYFGFY